MLEFEIVDMIIHTYHDFTHINLYAVDLSCLSGSYHGLGIPEFQMQYQTSRCA